MGMGQPNSPGVADDGRDVTVNGEVPPGLEQETLRGLALIEEHHPPWRTEYHEVLDSTQSEALRRVESVPRPREPFLLVAGHQHHGHGQRSRRWLAPPGKALLFTAATPLERAGHGRPGRHAEGYPLSLWPLQTGLALLLRLGSSGWDVSLKWPNDLLVKEHKVGGILCEVRSGWLLIGVGLNLLQGEDEFAGIEQAAVPPGSLAMLAGTSCPAPEQMPPSLLQSVVSILERPWESQRMLEHYRQVLGDAAVAPGTPIARQVIALELLLPGGDAEALKQRLGAAYESDIAAVADGPAATVGDLPPTITAPPPPGGDDGAAGAGHTGWRKGDRIGPYTFRKKLGSGGFGEVWLAERRDPRMLVAIKVLRPGVREADSIARFSMEAQALAYLDHPAIVAVLNAGQTEQGLPYLVMPYIEGVPLTRYCDAKRLTLQQRLELMARVCEAVHHAHMRGLIHRDLSPDNILVTEVRTSPRSLEPRDRLLVVGHEGDHAVLPQPKIVDFGLAKAAQKSVRLADGTVTRDLGKLMGKPEYMAPEQAGHQPREVDTRSDIFALGVILYELLTGVLPLSRQELRDRAPDEMVQTLRQQPRPQPSTRFLALDAQTARQAAQMRGELSVHELSRTLKRRVRHLVGTAMRLEKGRRFTSAAAMARDIHNYLDGLDYDEAAAEPWWERAWRNIRRHKLAYGGALLVSLSLLGGMVAVAVVLLSLLGGLTATATAYRRAERQRAAAVAAEQREAAQRRIAETREREALAAREAEAAQWRIAEAEAERARRSEYATRIATAEREIELANIARARALLDGCPADLRHFEWHHLRADGHLPAHPPRP